MGFLRNIVMLSGINPIAIHYFLWFSALTPIYGYVSVYAEHYANATSSQYGLLNMVLPFAAIIAKLFFCSLADRQQAHRSYFIIFLITAFIGYGSYGILPFFILPQPKDLGLNLSTWILICIMTSLSTISMGVISCLSDAFAMSTSRKSNSSYGFIRLWGTLGWGASSVALAFINQYDKLPLLVPGLIMTILLLVSDILIASLWPKDDDYKLDQATTSIEFENFVSNKETDGPSKNCHSPGEIDYGATSDRNMNVPYSQIHINRSDCDIDKISPVRLQWMLFKEVATRRRSIFRYMIIFITSGALISLQWSYFFLYLSRIYAADFNFISGLSMVGQSMLGELPFFILSDILIRKLGRSHTLSISVISIGIRYLLYEFLLPNSSMYFVLMTETLQGPSFGLFYVVMTEVGLDYSDCEDAIISMIRRGIIANNPQQIKKLRVALCATMQSLMSACYEGLGLGIGSIVGGLIIDIYGFSHLWLWSSIFAITIGIANMMIEISGIPVFIDAKPECRAPVGRVM